MHSIIRFFYPDLDEVETRKFTLLGSLLFLLIGAYWLLRLVKYTLMFKVAFPEALGWTHDMAAANQAMAKTWSPWIILILVGVYSAFVDKLARHRLFCILCGIYAVLFGLLGAFLLLVQLFPNELYQKAPMAIMGWSSFFLIESFGSLVIAMFWAFTNSLTKTTSAKKGYPVIYMMAALGAIFGSASLVFFTPESGALWPLIFGASAAIAGSIGIVLYFVKSVPRDPEAEADLNKKSKDVPNSNKGPLSFVKNFFSGGWLILKNPYLIGVLVVSTVYEIVTQIVEFQMQRMAQKVYITDQAFNVFEGYYGVAVNAVTFFVTLIGLSIILRRFGTRVALLIYPVSSLIILVFLFLFMNSGVSPELNTALWVTVVSMVFIKGLGYAVNNPSKEILWIPTSKDIKFKSKGWIDSFAARFAKSGGGVINSATLKLPGGGSYYGYLAGIAIIIAWGIAAVATGNKNKKLVDQKKIIE